MKIINLFVLAAIGINAIVLPNARQELLVVLLAIGALLALRARRRVPRQTIIFIMTSLCVTMLYVLIGYVRDAPSEALAQAIFVYIISPILWLLVIDLAWQMVGFEKMHEVLAIFALAASVSVGIYIYLFLNFGAQSVEFFGSNTNVHLDDNYSGVIMHVAGSLIFLGAAFMAGLRSAGRRMFDLVVAGALVLAVLSSGRTAAVVGLAVGGFILMYVTIVKFEKRVIINFVIIPFAAFLIILAMEYFLQVDVFQLLEIHFNKIEGGDVERPAQITALLKGATETGFLGAGHGIGVDYLRSFEFPWRYEAVFVALLYKVGLIGYFIVLAPLFIALSIFIKALATRNLRRYDCFFGAGLIAAVFAGFTNPYPEAFAFQWMYILPTYYFFSGERLGLSL